MHFVSFLSMIVLNLFAIILFVGLLKDDEDPTALVILYGTIAIDVVYMIYGLNMVPYSFYYYIWGYCVIAMLVSPLFELIMMRYAAFDKIKKVWITEYIENEPVVLSNDNFSMAHAISYAPFRIPGCIVSGGSTFIQEILNISAIKQAEHRSKTVTK